MEQWALANSVSKCQEQRRQQTDYRVFSVCMMKLQKQSLDWALIQSSSYKDSSHAILSWVLYKHRTINIPEAILERTNLLHLRFKLGAHLGFDFIPSEVFGNLYTGNWIKPTKRTIFKKQWNLKEKIKFVMSGDWKQV